MTPFGSRSGETLGVLTLKKVSPASAKESEREAPGDFGKCPASFDLYGHIPSQRECLLLPAIANNGNWNVVG
jgi:hypothetical protein